MVYPGRLSLRSFALSYYLSGFQPFQSAHFPRLSGWLDGLE
jgi:hypothetical protein